MIITVLKEITEYEQRTALTPATTKTLIDNGATVVIEKGSGQSAGFPDEEYRAAGAKIAADPAETLHNADFLFKIHAPTGNELTLLPDNLSVIADFRGFEADEELIRTRRLSLYALEHIPRISRAQNMDILSSQDNLAGYKAVIEAVNMLNRAVPMMTTAAGSIPPAKILIIGIGVAGLQAIATAKRLGAVVYASDIRPETCEQAESLGARFVKPTDTDAVIADADIIITAAGSPPNAPLLIKTRQLATIRRNSILMDISGNVQDLTPPETYTTETGAIITGNTLTAALLPKTASILFANNICSFFRLLHQNTTTPDFNDEIINRTCLYYQGQKRE